MPDLPAINGDEEPNLSALDEVAVEALLIVEAARLAGRSRKGQMRHFDLGHLTPVEKRVLLALLWTENHLPPPDPMWGHGDNP